MPTPADELKASIALYSSSANCSRELVALLPGVKVLDAFDGESLRSASCLILDIRHQPEILLEQLEFLRLPMPVLAVADADQALDSLSDGVHWLQDFVTPTEVGSALFWFRVNKAVKAFAEPFGIPQQSLPIRGLLQEIVNHTSDWIFVKDLSHRFLLASESFAQSAGLSNRELIGKNDLDIGNSAEHVLGNPEKGWRGFWPQDDAVTDSGLTAIEENQHWDLYSNTERYRRTIRVPLRNTLGDVYGLLVCSQDITEQRQNESMLKERTEVLARVIEQKKYAESCQRTAEDAVAAKTRFLAAASHDLRQPLHAMGLFLDILDKRMSGTDEQKLLKQIKQSCTSLNTLFNGCLDISRLDAGVVESVCENIRVSTFLEGLNEEFSQQAAEKSLQYVYSVDESVVYSDPMLLSRIVRNLVNNAFENTITGQLSIRCKGLDDCVQLSVRDTGTGIPKTEIERIFNEFHQIDSHNARQGKGLGLGLAIVKRLCGLLDIDIQLESTAGEGSCFYLSLPKGEAEKINIPEQEARCSSLKGTRVLIIDDDLHIQHGMQVLLSTYGCETYCAFDAASAASVLDSQSQNMDIIVADYHLANGETGSTVIDEVRTRAGYQVPAILVTGDTTSDSESEAKFAALTLLYKPVSADVLLSNISSELSERAQR